ncbi:MAG: hypothetical protein Q7U57_14600 [Methylovulum sp.]|nr:hypothetical protein [Methylovulum sp.]
MKRSHAIPNSSFKKIFSGRQARILTNDAETHGNPTNDSWKTYQLCNECEQHLNKSYEGYSLLFLRGKKGKKIESDGHITFSELKIEKLQLFFLSIFWRAANSEDVAYREIFIPEPWNNELREYIYKNHFVPLNLMTVKISRLTYRGKKEGKTQMILNGMIFKPFYRQLLYNCFAFCFLFEGFFVEIFMPGHGFKAKGVINPKKDILVASFLDLFDIPEFKQAASVMDKKLTQEILDNNRLNSNPSI